MSNVDKDTTTGREITATNDKGRLSKTNRTMVQELKMDTSEEEQRVNIFSKNKVDL